MSSVVSAAVNGIFVNTYNIFDTSEPINQIKSFFPLFFYFLFQLKQLKTPYIYTCTCTRRKRVCLVPKELKIKLSFLPSSCLTTNVALQETVPTIAFPKQGLLAHRRNRYGIMPIMNSAEKMALSYSSHSLFKVAV